MCEFCNTEQDEIFKGADGKWYMRVDGTGWNDWNDCPNYTDVEIVYCPYCGRKLI